MKDNKKWKTKEEAEEYISKAIQSQNYGLSYCSACDFLGVNPIERSGRTKGFYLGLLDDCFISWSNKQIRDFIDQLQDEILTAEYVDSHKCKDPDEYLATAEEVLKVAKQQLRERHGYERKQLLKRYKLYKSNKGAEKNRKNK